MHFSLKEYNANNHLLVITENVKGFLPMNGQKQIIFFFFISKLKEFVPCNFFFLGVGGEGKETKTEE